MQLQPIGYDVYLNLYEYTSCSVLQALGLAAYHSAVQYNNTQYHYIVHSPNPLSSGIISKSPGSDGRPLLHRLFMGRTCLSPQQLAPIYRQLEEKYTNGRYHLFKNNCNHFSDELLGVLVGGRVPKWVFRLTDFLRVFSWMMPRETLNAQRALGEERRREMKEVREFMEGTGYWKQLGMYYKEYAY